MNSSLNRRRFLAGASLAGASLVFGKRRLFAKGDSPNEKLNIGVIGTAGRAGDNLAEVRGENIVALCDVNATNLAAAQVKFPGAKMYADFRKMIEQPGLDAVVVSATDHTHAPATLRALKSSLHVYCEKPLTHSVYEARQVAEAARAAKVATQMGTQIHAGANYRRVVELVRGGAIGKVSECHVWVGKAWGGGERPTEAMEVPRDLDWDLWLGPAPERPYHSTYLPANWRRWWDFGNGTLGDMGCHYLDLPFWALDLTAPSEIETEGPEVSVETTPFWLIARYQFPARGEQPPVKLTWYDGGARPDELLASVNLKKSGDGVLFVGEKGMLFADYNNRVLLPEEGFKDFAAPAPTIPDSIGHHAEWLLACKTGSPTTCNFAYGAALTEAVLLGNVAYRAGQKITWQSEALKVGGAIDAQRFIQREYRAGWST